MDTYIPLLGRICMYGLFLNSVISKLNDPAGVISIIAEKGVPFPEFVAWVIIIIELIAPFLLLIGYKARIMAFILVLWLLPVTFIMHPFTDAKQQGAFLKNFAIIGGLLFVAKAGAGKWAVERV